MRDEPHWTRHSLVLFGAGLIYIGIGIAFIYAPGYVGKDPSLKSALRLLTLNEWGWLYIAAGIAAGAASIFPLGKKVWGYMVLTALSAAWAWLYSMSVFFAGAPKITLLSGLIWLLLAFIWWAVSGLLSPEHVEKMMYDATN
jgi:hypothetical protein